MTLVRFRRLLLAATTVAAAPAHTQSASTSEPIVVIGESLDKAREASFAYVREIGIARGDEQVARWLSPICPNVVGIAAPQAEQARQRIRSLIRKVGAPLAAEKCKPNMVLVFSGDPKAFMKMVARRARTKLKTTPDRAGREFLFGDAASRWWYDTGIRSKDNIPAGSELGPHVSATVEATAEHGAGIAEPPVRGDTVATNQYSASLISTPTVRAISAATIVVDFTVASDLGLSAVTDFAALVGLAEIKPGAVPDSSILSLFNLGSTRRELSNRDLAFLSGLYRIAMDREAHLQRTSLVSQMTRSDRPGVSER